MYVRSWGIKVRKNHGEAFRKALQEMNALDRSRKIGSDESYIYIPVLKINEIAGVSGLQKVGDYEPVEMDFQVEEQPKSLEEILGFRPGFEVVGDIAIVENIDAERVASALMSTSKNIKVVIAPISDVEGEFRTRRFRHVAGEERTITIHKEHGLRYRVDLERAYFTPRLGTERLRVARLVRPGDMVLDMFAGVGPFALLMSKKGARVMAIDKNPAAVRHLRENAQINKIENIEILEGDAGDLSSLIENQADHVIMNLPHSASQFLGPAMRAAKPGGFIHYYAIAPEEDLYRDLDLIKNASAQMGLSVEVTYKGVVRSYAPHRYNVVIDFCVDKSL